MGMFSFLRGTPTLSRDPNKINELLNRGVEKIFPSPDFLRRALLSGRRLKIYLGIDPTGPSLHLGHAIPLMKLRQFQELGHQAILLIGDFTATIGDPTDKLSARVPLSREQVLKNAKQYKKQASTLLKFNGTNPAQIKYNSHWLNKLSMVEITELLAQVTYGQTIKRDMFQQRIAEGKDLYVSEFLYPILQGYDSVAMDVDGEVGGNDQTFNMLVGRDLLKKYKQKEKFVLTLKILEDPTGKKMGKTENNMVALSDTASEMFGKIMSWPDGMIGLGFELLTFISLNQVENFKKQLEQGANPKEIKSKLAKEVVSIYHGHKAGLKAVQDFESTFKSGNIPDEIEIFKTTPASLVSILVTTKVVSSKTEFRRLIEGGAVEELTQKNKITNLDFEVKNDSVFKIGKKRFLKVAILTNGK